MWCALEQICSRSVEECGARQPFNATWFVSPSVQDASLKSVDAIPLHCQTGIITSVQQCPAFRSKYYANELFF